MLFVDALLFCSHCSSCDSGHSDGLEFAVIESSMGMSMTIYSWRIPFTRFQITIDRIVLENVEADEVMKELAIIQANQGKGK